MKKTISIFLLSLCVIISLFALPISVQATTSTEPTSISFKNAPLTPLGVGETHQLTLTATPTNSSTVYTWMSSNPDVVSVDSKGLVTAKQVGIATITARTYTHITTSCTITVKDSPTYIKLNKYDLTLGRGEVFNFEHTLLPNNTASYKVTYTSSNNNVATVGPESGLVTAKNCGTTYITATTYNGITTTSKVTVKPLPYWVKFKTAEITLGIGDTHTLEHYYPDGTYSSYDVEYSSNNPNIAAVNETTGVVTAKAVGTVLITVKTRNGVSTTCSIDVKRVPQSIEIFETSTGESNCVEIGEGETIDFSHKFPEGSYTNAIEYTVAHPCKLDINSSTGKAIAKINKQGLYTTVYVKTESGLKDSCEVGVFNPPSKVNICNENVTLKIGESKCATKLYKLPEGEASFNTKYRTSNSSVVAIDEKNNLVAKKVGTATITITTYNGKSASCKVTVLNNNPSKITLNTRKLTLGVGENYQLSYSLPSGTVADSISYYNYSGNDVASVNQYGMITAKKVGTAQIYVKTNNGKTDYCIVTVKPAPYWIKLNRTSVTLGTSGDTIDLNHSIPSGTAWSNIRYYSSNTSVATVNPTSGYVTAKKAGKAMITVTTHKGMSTCCQVTVKAAPYKLELNVYNQLLKVNETSKITYKIPAGTASNKITYSSSNSSIVSVNSSGVITAKRPGTAIITVTTHNSIKNTCKVTVIK